MDNVEHVKTIVCLSHKSPDSDINVKVKFGKGEGKVPLDAIAEQIAEIHQKAYEVYLPRVEDACSRIVSEAELLHLLDYLLDFACDEKTLRLYKKVCRRYLYVYPRGIKFYIEAYREIWEDENK